MGAEVLRLQTPASASILSKHDHPVNHSWPADRPPWNMKTPRTASLKNQWVARCFQNNTRQARELIRTGSPHNSEQVKMRSKSGIF
jgi:hypothetical protein